MPPPLPKRNVHQFRQRVSTETNTLNNKRALSHINGKVPLDINSFNNEINSNIANTVPSPRKRIPPFGPLVLDKSDKPPPLPPRTPHSAPLPQPLDPEAVNSINKQMSYPLVATCATLVNNYVSNTVESYLMNSQCSMCLPSPLRVYSAAAMKLPLLCALLLFNSSNRNLHLFFLIGFTYITDYLSFLPQDIHLLLK